MKTKTGKTALGELRAAWEEMTAGGRGMRTREAAMELGCGEADLVAAGIGSTAVWRLDGDRAKDWLGRVAEQAGWMWLVRNDWAVLEKDVTGLRAAGETFGYTDEETEVGLDAGAFRSGICLLTEPEQRLALSIQVFNARGEAVLKLYLKKKDRKEAVLSELKSHLREVGENRLSVPGAPVGSPEMETVPESEWTVEASLHRDLIEAARDRKEALELSAANSGARMRVRWQPRTIRPMETWFNILDRGFNLHLREEGLRETRCSVSAGMLTARMLHDNGDEGLRLKLPAEAARGIPALRKWSL
jgi:putative hemin transport protein